MGSLQTRFTGQFMRETLNTLPCNVIRPQPPLAWIKKHRPTVRHPSGPWNPALLLPTQSNATLAERHCDELPSPPTAVIPRSTRPSATRIEYRTPLAWHTVTKQACEEAWIDNRGSVPRVHHATEPLSPMTASDFRPTISISRRLREKLSCM